MKTIAALQKTRSETTVEWSRSGLTFVRAAAPLAARVLLALVFLLSGISKLHSPGSASAFVAGIVPIAAQTARIIVIALSLTEIGAGCLLLVNRWVATLALMFSLFLLASTFVAVLFVSEGVDCGCFGALGDSGTKAHFLTRNFCLLILGMLVLKASPKSGAD